MNNYNNFLHYDKQANLVNATYNVLNVGSTGYTGLFYYNGNLINNVNFTGSTGKLQCYVIHLYLIN